VRFQVFGDTGGSFQSKCAPAGQENGVDAFYQMPRIAHHRFARSRRRAANINATNASTLTENHCAAGDPFKIAAVADTNSRKRRILRHYRQPWGESSGG
jgi:hypothetical protein